MHRRNCSACFCAVALLCAACSPEAYDVSRGIDKEMTLFTEEVSLPVGDVGPISLGILLDKSGFRSVIQDFVQEDSEGYLVMSKEGEVYSNWILMLSMLFPDTSRPVDFPAGNISGTIETMSSSVAAMGLSLDRQVFTLTARNPLTEEISVSGKLTLRSEASGNTPAEAVASQDFAQTKVAAQADNGVVVKIERSNEKAFYGYDVDGLTFHLPEAFVAKDASGGLGLLRLAYEYKAYLALGENFAFPFNFDIGDLDLPLGQYKVKEAKICTEVSSEIPVSLTVNSVEVLVRRTGEDGSESLEPCGDVSVTPGLKIASGCSGSPKVTPLEIVVKADEGTIPDIAGLRVDFNVQPPTGDSDKRLGMNQFVYFNNLRATVSGGITIQSL